MLETDPKQSTTSSTATKKKSRKHALENDAENLTTFPISPKVRAVRALRDTGSQELQLLAFGFCASWALYSTRESSPNFLTAQPLSADLRAPFLRI